MLRRINITGIRKQKNRSNKIVYIDAVKVVSKPNIFHPEVFVTYLQGGAKYPPYFQ